MASRKRIAHGQKRKLAKVVTTLADSATPTATLDFNAGDHQKVTTYNGTSATGIILDFINAYPGAEMWIHFVSSNESDALGAAAVNGDSFDTTLVGGSFNDNAVMLIHAIVESDVGGSSVLILNITTIS